MKILMVCLGNICRSPLAQGILEDKAKNHSLDIYVDSAGFESYHTGQSPDPRSREIAKKHGINISGQRARMFKYSDFEKFDRIYVMDHNNYADVLRTARTEEDKKKVDLILNLVAPGHNLAVPDPYYDSIKGFEKVYEMLDKACEVLTEEIKIQGIKKGV